MADFGVSERDAFRGGARDGQALNEAAKRVLGPLDQP